MVEIGYSLSSEEHDAPTLIANAQAAEAAGFKFAFISDHYHPWTSKQGQSPFVWSVIGAISQVTSKLRIGTGVTCPLIRIHPAIIAQSAATVAQLLPGRFILGLGTGENLNEHVVGNDWPPIDIRHEMMREAVEIIRKLWEGGSQSYYGQYYAVDKACIFSLPTETPPIMLAAAGPKSAQMSAEISDGLIATSASSDTIKQFNANGGKGKPKYGQITVCYHEDAKHAQQIAYEWWPNAALPGQLSQELRLPQYFDQAVKLVKPEGITESIVCGPNPDDHITKIQEFIDAGFDHVYVHQVGPEQDKFMQFYQQKVLPKFHK